MIGGVCGVRGFRDGGWMPLPGCGGGQMGKKGNGVGVEKGVTEGTVAVVGPLVRVARNGGG